MIVPAYHYGAEIEALERFGLVCRFYDAQTGSLEPDEEGLEELIGPRTRGLYLIHYLGILQDAARWRTWCNERGLLLIEDAAQAWLGSRDGVPAGSHGDLSLFCLYKTFGLPDGAAVVCKAPLEKPPANRRTGLYKLALRHASFLARRWTLLAGLRRRLAPRPAREYVPEKDFELSLPEAPSSLTRFLLPRVATAESGAVRSANYHFLLERLGGMVPKAFAVLPEGSSPFAFPIFSERKGDLLGWLESRGVSAFDLWSVPHPVVKKEDFPNAARLRDHVVALPVYQELSRSELERMVDAVLHEPRRTT